MRSRLCRRYLVLVLALALGTILPQTVGADDAPGLAGTWTWSWKDPRDASTHRHLLEVEGDGATLAARERFDDMEPVRVQHLQQKGKKVGFTVVRGQRRSEYSGAIDGDSIVGTVTVTYEGQVTEFVWKARKEHPGAKARPRS